jgi:hypothetical protein
MVTLGIKYNKSNLMPKHNCIDCRFKGKKKVAPGIYCKELCKDIFYFENHSCPRFKCIAGVKIGGKL